MNKIQIIRLSILFVFLLVIDFTVSAQTDSLNMTKTGHWSDGNLATEYNDIWGYATDGREYAIVGSNHSTHFLDVTDSTPVLISSFPGNDEDVIWRDFKTYKHYAYGVADGGDNSLQIFDLAYLPDSVVKVYDSQEFTVSCHNIFIEGDRLYLCSNIRNGLGPYALDVLSLANPEQPSLITNVPSMYFSNNGVHDIYVKNDTAFCSGEYSGMYIYDFTDLFNPALIASILQYEDKGYNHSSWVSEDGKTLVMADEVPTGMALKLFDITDITDPNYLTKFEPKAEARPHNPFFRDDKIIISYYQEGVQIYDVANPSLPYQSAFYDTYPDNDTIPGGTFPDDEYNGCWGVYPFLPTGNIIASDTKHGLFVLSTPEIQSTVGIKKRNGLFNGLEMYPNPISAENTLKFRCDYPVESVVIRDLLGKVILNNVERNSYLSEVELPQLRAGVYIVEITTTGVRELRRLVVE